MLAALPVAALPIASQESGRAAGLSAAEWRSDIDHMMREMERTHADLCHSATRAELEGMVASLVDRLPSLERHEVTVELARIVAAVGDGHTRLWLYDELLRAGRALLGRDEHDAALTLFRLAVKEYPESPYAHEAVGDALRALGDLRAAAASYRRMMEIAPRGLPNDRARLRIRSLAGG